MYQSLLVRGGPGAHSSAGISSKWRPRCAQLSLKETVQLALSQNRSLRIARLKVPDEQQKAGERSAYFPSLTNQSNVIHITTCQNSVFPPAR